MGRMRDDMVSGPQNRDGALHRTGPFAEVQAIAAHNGGPTINGAALKFILQAGNGDVRVLTRGADDGAAGKENGSKGDLHVDLQVDARVSRDV